MKKFLALILSVGLMLSLSVQAFATEAPIDPIEEAISQYALVDRLNDATIGYIDPTVPSNIVESISVSFATKDVPVRALSTSKIEQGYAIRNLGSVTDGGEPIGTIYAVTAAEKEISDDDTQNGVYAWITMVWIDHFGTNNEIVSVSGGWNPNGATISDRDVTYGHSSNGSYASITAHPSSNSYNYDDLGVRGFRLFAESEAKIDGVSSPISVEVSPTIFD